MGKAFDIPLVWGQNIIGKGIKIPSVGVKIQWVGSSIYHE